jgi:1-acyl-sn-glycerol-3-phosphate acyltransferase
MHGCDLYIARALPPNKRIRIMRNLSPVSFFTTEQALSVNVLGSKYHRHSVVGSENIPEDGAWLMITNHSFASYENMMMTSHVLEKTGRIVRSLGDRAIFKIPLYREYCVAAGVVEGNNKIANQLLDDGEIVMISPGGMAEALRTSEKKRTLMWETRKGFVRLAVRKQVPLVLCACPAADDIFDIAKSKLSDAIYDRFRMPFAILKGRWGLPFPKPVKLTHYVAKPFSPRPVDESDKPAFDAEVDRLHAEVSTHMQSMLDNPGSGV